MRASPVLLCCWPGLPRLWLQGDWQALSVAVAFGWVLIMLLVSSFQWTDVMSATCRILAWMSVSGVWLFSAIRSYRGLSSLAFELSADDSSLADRGLFLQSQGEYLRGHWFEAESLLKQLLHQSRQDVDAHFLLATLYRRTRRYDEARARLQLLEQLDRADKWRWEIAAERRLMQRQEENGAMKGNQTQPVNDGSGRSN